MVSTTRVNVYPHAVQSVKYVGGCFELTGGVLVPRLVRTGVGMSPQGCECSEQFVACLASVRFGIEVYVCYETEVVSL